VTVQGLAARVLAQVGAWAKAKVEAGWVGRLQQGRVDVVSVPTAEQQLLMLWGSPVMKKAVQNVEVQ